MNLCRFEMMDICVFFLVDLGFVHLPRWIWGRGWVWV